MAKLLVIRRNRLGDAISVLPWLQGLKITKPELEIDILTNPYASAVFERCEVVRKVFVLPEKHLGTPLGLLFHPVLRQIRGEKEYEFVVNASYSFSTKASILAYFVPGHQKVGVVSKNKKLVNRVWTHPVDQRDDIQAYHQVQRVAYIGDVIGLHSNTLPEAKLMNKNNSTQAIGLCPVVNRSQSRWIDAHWLDLEKKLKQMGFPIIWLGAKPVRAISEHVELKSTREFLNAVEMCSMLICCEGGASHVGPALGVPTIILSGMAVRNTWIPWSRKAVLLEQEDVNKFASEDVIEQVLHWKKSGRFNANANTKTYLNDFVL